MKFTPGDMFVELFNSEYCNSTLFCAVFNFPNFTTSQISRKSRYFNKQKVLICKILKIITKMADIAAKLCTFTVFFYHILYSYPRRKRPRSIFSTPPQPATSKTWTKLTKPGRQRAMTSSPMLMHPPTFGRGISPVDLLSRAMWEGLITSCR